MVGQFTDRRKAQSQLFSMVIVTFLGGMSSGIIRAKIYPGISAFAVLGGRICMADKKYRRQAGSWLWGVGG
jgi:hypothetical protein